MSKNKAIKIAVILLTLLFGTIFSLYSKIEDKHNGASTMTLREYFVQSFISELPEISKNLPHKVDNITTLLSIEYLNGKIISRYQLDNIDKNTKTITDFINKIKPILIKQACSDEAKSKLLEVDVEFIEKYQDPKGAAIFEATIKRLDCLNIDLYK